MVVISYDFDASLIVEYHVTTVTKNLGSEILLNNVTHVTLHVMNKEGHCLDVIFQNKVNTLCFL